MTYPAALELQILACRGLLARCRLFWHVSDQVRLEAATVTQLEHTMAEGLAAVQLLWEAGIRFSFTRVLTEAECVGRPGGHPARREAP